MGERRMSLWRLLEIETGRSKSPSRHMDTNFVWITREEQLINDQDIGQIQYMYSFNQMGNLKG